jgi:hypothetical protein
VIEAVPLRGGSPSTICDTCTAGFGPARLLAPITSWSADGKFFFASLQFFGIHSTKTLAVPTHPGEAPPSFASNDSLTEAKLASIPGARLIKEQNVFPGPDPDTYLYMRTGAQTNLYRVYVAE